VQQLTAHGSGYSSDQTSDGKKTRCALKFPILVQQFPL
jgi:hypothetical protein